jgi:hypothetical protein
MGVAAALVGAGSSLGRERGGVGGVVWEDVPVVALARAMATVAMVAARMVVAAAEAMAVAGGGECWRRLGSRRSG